MPPGLFGSTTIDCSACMEKANTRGTAGATGVVVALESVSKMAADITDGRALGGNLRLIRSPHQRLLARANVVDRMSGSMRGNSAASDRSKSRSRRTLMEEMPRKSAAELEAECLRLLAMDPHTRGTKRVEIIRMYPKGTGPNWTYGALDPMPTRAGVAIAQTLIASVYGRWALAD